MAKTHNTEQANTLGVNDPSFNDDSSKKRDRETSNAKALVNDNKKEDNAPFFEENLIAPREASSEAAKALAKSQTATGNGETSPKDARDAENTKPNAIKKKGSGKTNLVEEWNEAAVDSAGPGGDDHCQAQTSHSEKRQGPLHTQNQESQAENQSRAKCDIAGVKCSWIVNEFIPSRGGRRAFKGLTTDDVLQKHTKELTKQLGVSHCDLLKRQGRHDAVKAKADAFVSHWFGCMFLDVVDAIGRDLSKDGGSLDSYIWWDVFSINQHGLSNWSFEWLSTTFKGSIGKIGKVIMAMSPWNDPKPFARGWCVFEICSAIATNSQFEIALSQRDEQQFTEDIKKNGAIESINEMLADVSAEKSQCSVEAERDRTFQVARDEVGFSKLDGLLFEKHRSWAIDTAVLALNSCNDELEKCDVLNLLGLLHDQKGNAAAAKQCFMDCLEKRKSLLGDDDEDTLTVMSNLGLALGNLGGHERAEELHSTCFTMRAEALGCNHPDTLISASNCARVVERLGACEWAKQLCECCLSRSKKALGRDHPITLCSMNNLVGVLERLGDHERAKELCEQCLAKTREALGDDHPDTLTNVSNLASVLENLGDCKKAKKLHECCLVKRKTTLGDDHPDTLHSMNNLAFVLERLGEPRPAEALCAECAERSQRVLGADHPDAIVFKAHLDFVRSRIQAANTDMWATDTAVSALNGCDDELEK